MRSVITIFVAIVLLISGSLAPSFEAASAATLTKSGCSSPNQAVHSCCCGHAPGTPCPCEVAPSAPQPQPLERASVSSNSERPVTALAPSRLALPAPARPSLNLLDRFGRHGHLATAGPRLHLLESVFRN